MQKRQKSRGAAGNDARGHSVNAHDKISRLLGILATKDLERTAQVTLLRGVGFTIEEISEMLGISRNHVRVASHYGRKKKSKKAKKLKKVHG